MLEIIQEIKEKFDYLKKIDNKLKVFGADSHEYNLKETLTAKEMIEAIRQRIKEVNESINTQLDLRKKLEDHIEWFNNKARKSE